MEQSKSISEILGELQVAYSNYFKNLSNDEFLGTISLYKKQLGHIHPKLLNYAIDQIISKSRFMPTIAEILEECENGVILYQQNILLKMKNDGYFKNCGYKPATDSEETSRYYKALDFLSQDMIPSYLLEDMKRYGYEENLLNIKTQNEFLEIGYSR